MNSFNSLILYVFLVFFFSGCTDKNKDTVPDTPGESKREYQGNAQTSIRYYTYNPHTGLDEFLEEKQYSYPVVIYIHPPLEEGGILESNPFNLQVFPDRSQNPDEEGHLDLSSALIFNTTSGRVLLQYWQIQLVGEVLTGSLTDTHLAEAAAANLIWAWDDIAGTIMTMPFPISQGCSLQGSLNSTMIQITLQGESENTYRKFHTTISASRV
jgi:hypothetical protein